MNEVVEYRIKQNRIVTGYGISLVLVAVGFLGVMAVAEGSGSMSSLWWASLFVAWIGTIISSIVTADMYGGLFRSVWGLVLEFDGPPLIEWKTEIQEARCSRGDSE